ncbi:MAG: hypothetical protein WBJ62_04720, partial [Coriobacteriia bacterium]
ARAEADRKARAAMAAARVKEATIAKAARAEVDRNARLGMDKARQAQGAATRERNDRYMAAWSGAYTLQLWKDGWSQEGAEDIVAGITSSEGYKQWYASNPAEWTRRSNAANLAAWEEKRSREGKYGSCNWDWRRSQEEGDLGWYAPVAGSADFTVMGLKQVAGEVSPKLAKKIGSTAEGVGFFVDLGMAVDTYYKWEAGSATFGDMAWSAVGCIPVVSSIQLIHDIGAPIVCDAFRTERNWAEAGYWYERPTNYDGE